MAASDLHRQFLAENSQLLSCGGANVRREVSIDGGSPPLWSKEDQLWKLGGSEPGETAAIVSPMQGQAPVTVKTVPAQVGDFEKFAAHGFDWVPEERLYFTNLDRHVRCRAPNTWALDQSTRRSLDGVTGQNLLTATVLKSSVRAGQFSTTFQVDYWLPTTSPLQPDSTLTRRRRAQPRGRQL